ncbi:MAG: pyridoxal phosphate-dependent aminotransferase [Dehalococcoidia bacterium]
MGRIPIAERMSRLGTETAFEVLAKARALEAQGRSVVHLEIGEPDFDTPAHIRDAAKQALDDGFTHYGPSAGLPELREAIADCIGSTRGLSFGPDEVVVTPGGKPIMFFVMLAVLNEGDEAIYPNPGFPIYESVIDFLGATPVPVQLKEENDFRLDVDDLAAKLSPKTKLIILNSPHNPTGSVLTAEDLRRIADLLRGRDLLVLSDEIYSRMLYGGEFASIASLPGMREQTCILDGFSKTYAMTGWRLGYGVMPADLAAHVSRLMTNSNSCTASFVQRAGLAALRGPQESVAEMVAEFRRRRDAIVDGLNGIPGVRCREPKGAFYVFPNITGTGSGSASFADRLLEQHGVAALAGTSFGRFGEGYLRLSYANSLSQIRLALDRIGDAARAVHS